ncbi:hypothetical protein B0H16DRAFT_1702011 [Mycena metata]|uniref:Uncharacterized protein n=1 Tax=Mycena metata TaxID=1033252 RepID=A0AAD7H7U0_9AGAR|nr:hypothetical protein B0H16DRAFT_1702011 [Mycena metata]
MTLRETLQAKVLQEGTSTYRYVVDRSEIRGVSLREYTERSTSLKEAGARTRRSSTSSVEANAPLSTACGDTANDTAWCETLLYASVTKADMPPLSTPGLRLRAGHTAHDHYDDNVQSLAGRSRVNCARDAADNTRQHPPPTPLDSTAPARVPVYHIPTVVDDPDSAAHSGENKGHRDGGSFVIRELAPA